jgi:hypothetical protein
MESKMKLGIAWYRADQWELLKATATDPEIIEDTYQEWLANTKKRLEELREAGQEIVEVDFDVKKFNNWCENNEKALNGTSRSEYTARLLRIIDQSGVEATFDMQNVDAEKRDS